MPGIPPPLMPVAHTLLQVQEEPDRLFMYARGESLTGQQIAAVMGPLFRGAEHAQRHAGQLATTVRIVRGLRLVG